MSGSFKITGIPQLKDALRRKSAAVQHATDKAADYIRGDAEGLIKHAMDVPPERHGRTYYQKRQGKTHAKRKGKDTWVGGYKGGHYKAHTASARGEAPAGDTGLLQASVHGNIAPVLRPAIIVIEAASGPAAYGKILEQQMDRPFFASTIKANISRWIGVYKAMLKEALQR